MQKFKILFASLIMASIGLLSYVVLAQNKTQTPPVVVSAVAPYYPTAARAIGLNGDFLVDVEIDRTGKVVSSEVSKNSKEPKFMRKYFEEAANRWKFAPDENAEKRRRIQITFALNDTRGEPNLDSTTVFYPPYKIEVRDNTEFPFNPKK